MLQSKSFQGFVRRRPFLLCGFRDGAENSRNHHTNLFKVGTNFSVFVCWGKGNFWGKVLLKFSWSKKVKKKSWKISSWNCSKGRKSIVVRFNNQTRAYSSFLNCNDDDDSGADTKDMWSEMRLNENPIKVKFSLSASLVLSLPTDTKVFHLFFSSHKRIIIIIIIWKHWIPFCSAFFRHCAMHMRSRNEIQTQEQQEKISYCFCVLVSEERWNWSWQKWGKKSSGKFISLMMLMRIVECWDDMKLFSNDCSFAGYENNSRLSSSHFVIVRAWAQLLRLNAAVFPLLIFLTLAKRKSNETLSEKFSQFQKFLFSEKIPVEKISIFHKVNETWEVESWILDILCIVSDVDCLLLPFNRTVSLPAEVKVHKFWAFLF